MSMEEIYDINVSGREYKISRNLLEKYPNSTLSKKCLSGSNGRNGLYFERPIPPFEAVLELYQTGSLHVPHNRCFAAFKDELDFWGFEESDINTCCKRKLASFQSEQRDLDNYHASDIRNSYKYETNECCSSCISGSTRMSVWNCLDNYDYNLVAKILFIVSIFVIMLSTTVAILQTHSEYNEPLSEEHWKIYFGQDYDKYSDIIILVDSHRRGNISLTELINELNLTTDIIDELLEARNHNTTFIYINWFCTAYFTLELIVRLVFCPKFKIFFKGILNWVDVLALLMAYVEIAVNYTFPKEEYKSNYLDIVQLLQVLRVLRLFRLTRNITGARVLIFAVKNSKEELFFMMVLLGTTSIVFGTLLYCCDAATVNNISYATWWAIITMTTVGYGDVVPSNTAGRIVGIACASFGILLIAITVPLFVNNFLTVYTYAQSKGALEKESKKQKQVKPHHKESPKNKC